MYFTDNWHLGLGHGLGMLLWIGLLITFIWLLVRTFSGARERRMTAHEILAERFARGEIDAQEYQQKKALLPKEEP